MKILIVFAGLIAGFWPGSHTIAAEKSKVFTLDENVWVLFYDVPSRRFRQSRDAFVRRDWESVEAGLRTGAGFLRAEADRSSIRLVEPLRATADRLDDISDNIRTSPISGSDLDAVFARAHWLLAQHYLELSIASRDAHDSKTAGVYLWATVHHMERTVLWSDARLTRQQHRSLESLADLAGRLRTEVDPTPVLKERPIVLAEKTLRDLGEHLNRNVWLKQD